MSCRGNNRSVPAAKEQGFHSNHETQVSGKPALGSWMQLAKKILTCSTVSFNSGGTCRFS